MAHLEGVWQTEESWFKERPALTNLIFELSMLVASELEVISKIELLSPLRALVTRGPALSHGEALDINALTRARSSVELNLDRFIQCPKNNIVTDNSNKPGCCTA